MSKIKEQNNRKAYALAFASFLLRNMEGAKRINGIILYGSVAKSISTEESDIDIFIDVEKPTNAINRNIKSVLERFYGSKESIIFSLLGVRNEIKLKIGNLNMWEDLKRSIMSEGIVLWGKFEAGRPKKTKHMTIFYWDRIEKNRGAFLNKIYGFKTGGKVYEGLVAKTGGVKLGKSCVMIPIRYRENFTELLKKYKVDARAVEVFV